MLHHRFMRQSTGKLYDLLKKQTMKRFIKAFLHYYKTVQLFSFLVPFILPLHSVSGHRFHHENDISKENCYRFNVVKQKVSTTHFGNFNKFPK